jgi:hypothetical protein
MNFDTRTVLDLMILDPDLERNVSAIVDGEKFLWVSSGKTSQNDFVHSVIPLVKDEIKFYLNVKLHRNNLKLYFLKKYIDLDKIDYFHLIPAVCKI